MPHFFDRNKYDDLPAQIAAKINEQFNQFYEIFDQVSAKVRHLGERQADIFEARRDFETQIKMAEKNIKGYIDAKNHLMVEDLKKHITSEVNDTFGALADSFKEMIDTSAQEMGKEVIEKILSKEK